MSLRNDFESNFISKLCFGKKQVLPGCYRIAAAKEMYSQSQEVVYNTIFVARNFGQGGLNFFPITVSNRGAFIESLVTLVASAGNGSPSDP